MQVAPLPAACQEAISKTGGKFATTRYAIPDEPGNAPIGAMANLTEAEQAELTEPACAAWNSWAATNSAAVSADLDIRYRNAALPVAPQTPPVVTRNLEKVAMKVWTEAMAKLSTTAPDAACRTSFNTVKTAW